MIRACSSSSFMLLLTTYLVCASGASISTSTSADNADANANANANANDGINETKLSQLARQRKPTKLTTKMPLPNHTTLIEPLQPSANTNEQREFYHPAVVSKPRLIERYDKRALDGHYEYRYVLSDGDVRYERAYWLPVGGDGNKKVLARKGYYSYPLPNHRFHTVFYTADHLGFREDESSISRTQPLLLRSLEVPNDSDNIVVVPAAVSVGVMDKAKPKQGNEQTNKINRKPNWTPATKSILQKGRIVAIVSQEAGTAATTRTTTKTTSNVGEASATVSRATNRPQINEEEVLKPSGNAISVSNAITTTRTSTRTTTTTTAATPRTIAVTWAAKEQPSAAKSKTINPIKAESVQTTAAATATATDLQTEPEQLATLDTTATVLSVD